MWPFRRIKENPVNKSIVALVGGASVAYTPKDYRSLSKAGYESCAAVYACVKLIANTASRIEWYVQRTDARGNANEIENHGLTKLLNRPNEVESGPRFTEKVLSHLLLAGNSYILKVSGTPSQPPQFLYTFRPDRVKVNPDKSGKFLVNGYTYDPGANPQTFPASEVLHLMEFHPTEDFYGLSRIEVAAMQVDTMNAAAEWNAKLLLNDMKPPGMLTARSNWDLDTLKKMFRENYQGAENAGTPLAFSGEDIEWKDLSINPKDADWLKGQQFTLRQICSIFGVDPCLVGDAEYATYSNKQEARKGLYQEVILPLMDLLRDEYQRWLVPLYGQGIQLEYDKDSIEELQEDRGKKYAYLGLADWLTVNEKRVATGFDEIVGGDVILVPISNVPLEEATAPPQPAPDFTPSDDDEEEEPPADEEPAPEKSARQVIKAVKKSFWTDPERKERLWATFEARVSSRSKSFREMAKDYMRAQGERVRQRLSEIGSLPARAEDMFDLEAETKEYVKKFYAWYKDHFVRAGQAGMSAAKGELFDDAEFKAGVPTSWVFRLTVALEEALRSLVFNSGTKVNKTTIEVIYQELKLAQTENKPVAKFAQDLADKVDELSRSRAMLWSRTESAKVDNFGQVEGYKATELVDMKGWMCSFVPTSREAHMKADSDYGNGIPLDEPFMVDNQPLDYPGDPAGDPGNVCNCLCSTYPVVGPGTGE